ncbi:hypothetical protein GS896_25760 [Rhodococcus hoagii]|nr:hypothetical protein [Prescottella equi]MBM4654087.1 hypothetical protein [Prescottella equi]MBM4719561.1 hypothetical protein [Prescottella equi]NKR23360.1 hypothetical protein [Prescottella equi]NKT56029.1 hypothetical protein [Prescottella equi]
MSHTKRAEDLVTGDVFIAPSGLGDGAFTVTAVEKRRNVPDPERNTYETEHEKMYLDVTRGDENFSLWFWPDQELTLPS